MASMLWRKFHIDDCCVMLERGLVVFTFYVALLTLFRAFFIGWLGIYDGYLESGMGTSDIHLAMWVGFKLSIQSAGILTAATMLPTVPFRFVGDWLWQKAAKVMTGIALCIISIMFCASIPYYRQFHSKFNQLLFNTANDDVVALTISLVQEFYLPLRLAVAFVLAAALWHLLWKVCLRCWLAREKVNSVYLGGLHFSSSIGWLRWLRTAALIGAYNLLSVLVVFGGSLGWETAVDWENAGVTRSEFLNEAILDDFQATYRGYKMNGRFLACNGLNFTTDHIKELAAHMANRPADTDNLDIYMTRRAQGQQIPRPKQVFVIVSESFANWPILDKYADLHIADGMKEIVAAADSDYCPYFLPNGSSTVSAVTGVVTGLADANLYLTTMPESFASPYPTAIAPMMKRLGYVTNFWYAGPATWERIGAFTVGQGFDSFHGMGDMPAEATGSVWGIDDEYLYDTVLKSISPDVDSFNVILNVSNHSPYNLDLAAKGFSEDKVKNGLPEDRKDDKELIRQLGHYWYADREMTKFVKQLKEKYPECLIIFMGDHADRYNVEKTPSMYERYGIPLVITGKGVHKGLFSADSAGSQIDVVSTIVEMIAPKGFEYETIGYSLTRGNKVGVNYGFWITRQNIGEADTYPLVPISLDGNNVPIDQVEMSIYIDTVRSLSWYRPKYGAILDEAKLINR